MLDREHQSHHITQRVSTHIMAGMNGGKLIRPILCMHVCYSSRNIVLVIATAGKARSPSC